ncbi:MAG: magnesium transporter CorA family protein [Gaiellaceae bacterium]
MATALLFDRDQVDEVEDWARRADRLGRKSILWIDLDSPERDHVRELVEGLELSRESEERLAGEDGRPYFGDFGSYLHVTAFVPSPNGRATDLVKVGCLVAEQWVVTVHDAPVEVFDEFRERACGSGETGRLDGPEFLANLLEWVLAAYLAAFEAVELDLEEFDTRAMEGTLEEPESELRKLVELRREVGRLRRALVSHREMFLALTRPELEEITSSKHAERFESLRGDLETAVQAARDSRDSVVGSFDVILARTGQRTNDIMKILTLGSLLLLPGALIAGVLGMNFKLAVFEDSTYFWIVLAFIFGLAATTLAGARARRWI